jgi:dihydroorotate dehydrogenase electron transfer subunit
VRVDPTAPSPAVGSAYERVAIAENRPLGRDAFVLTLGPVPRLVGAQPGQFIMLRGDWERDPILPRAFSILGVDGQGSCRILVKAIGRGTRLFQAAPPGADVSVLGPLGRRFPAPERGTHDLLVAGGVGLAPLLWHAQVARSLGFTPDLFYGARTAADLVLLDEIAATGARLHLTTEDGSRGRLGRVTAALEQHLGSPTLESGGRSRVLTCGPNPMMRAVVALARGHQLPSLVSVEGEMACGIGACLGCAVPLVGAERPYAYACVDGPVFDAEGITIP